MGVVKPMRRAKIRAENERLILAAAEQVFAEAGYGGATMQLIADLAGLPRVMSGRLPSNGAIR